MNKISRSAFSLVELSVVILIIGIMIGGVIKGGSLVEKMRQSGARSLTNSSQIASISDMVLWIESTLEESFSIEEQDDDVAVSVWRDTNPQSQNKLDLSQDTSGARPLYKTNSINGLPALKFDGVDDFFNASSSFRLSDVLLSDQVSIFMVAKATASPANYFAIGVRNASNNINPRANLAGTWGGTTYFDFALCCTSGVGRSSKTAPSDILGNTKVISYVVGSSTATLRLNGSAFINAVAMTGTFSQSNLSSSISALQLGGYSGGFFTGYIGEFIIFKRALKPTEIADVESYLSKKWGVRF